MTEGSKIRVLLTDDHPVVRKGIAQVFETSGDIEVVGEAETGEEALFLCGKLNPDVVIMDVKMDGLGGVETTRLISRHHAAVAVIGLSTFPQQDIVSAMEEAGASGYLLKDVSADELTQAVRRVRAGEKVFSENLRTRQNIETDRLQSGARSTETYKIGDQQKRVLVLMTKGLTNAEIAEQLGVSTPTARYHVSAILKKLDVSNRSEAVAIAMRERLVSEADL